MSTLRHLLRSGLASLPQPCAPSLLSLPYLRSRPYHGDGYPPSRGVGGARELLNTNATVHALHGDQVGILETPSEFFGAVKAGIRGASRRLAIATLYIGTGKCGGDGESELLDELQSAARRCREGDLQEMSVLVDALRATRPVSRGPGEPPTSTALELSRRGLSTAADGPAQAGPRVGLWHTTALRGLLKRAMPARANEALGVQHMKVYAWDDTVLVSGANLSDTYFTARQDRYILIRSESLADQVHDIIRTVMSHSYQLGPEGRLLQPPSGLDPAAVGSGHEAACRMALEAVVAPRQGQARVVPGPGERRPDTWVAPVLQMGHLGIRQDVQCTAQMLRAYYGAPSVPDGPAASPRLVLSSPYLNLLVSYAGGIRCALGAGVRATVLTASSESHGWKGASGIAGLLPAAYEVLRRETQAMLAAGEASRAGSCKLEMREYDREGWEFHAKGLWFLGSASEDGRAEAATAVGSSNLGVRSSELDLELQFIVLTRNKQLIERLEQEVVALVLHSSACEDGNDVCSSSNRQQGPGANAGPQWYIPWILPWFKWLL